MLPQSRLGNTELFVSRLGLGTVKFGRNQSVKYPETFELPSDDEARKLLHCACDLGINLLDTAPSYGTSEERLGYLLRGERKSWVISTKAGEEFLDKKDIHAFLSPPQSQFNFTPEALRLSVERSLRRLRTDYLDIVLIHSDGNDTQIIEQYQVLDTLATLKREGWIRAFGMSTKTLAGSKLCAPVADLIMATYDPEVTEDQQLLEACTKHSTGLLLKKIFNSGHLVSNLEKHESPNKVIEKKMQTIFAQSAVNSAIIGTLNCQHLHNNVECALSALADHGKLA